MALQLPSLFIIIPLSLFLFMLLKLMGIFKTKNSPSKLPPGPLKLPLIGNLHQLAGSLPHRALRDLAKKYGPLMHLQLGEISTVVISSPEIAEQVMKTHDIIFATRPQTISAKISTYGFIDIAFAPYGEYWRQLRKICIIELLSNKRVRSFQSIREDEVLRLFKRIASTSRHGKPINFTEQIFFTTCNIISRAAFGLKSNNDQQELFINLMKESINLTGGFSIVDLYPSMGFLELIHGMKQRLENLHQQMDTILEGIINQHRHRRSNQTQKDPGDADQVLLDVILKFHEDENQEFRLTTDKVKAVIQDIFSAGSDTAATTIEWAMAEMLRHPSIMKRAKDEVRQLLVFDGKGYVDESDLQELNYMKSVIKETLRLHPPATLLLPRECQEKCEINGYEIPFKTQVLINAWAIGRDPNFWDDAECFKPERFIDSTIDFRGNNFEYIPFGAGRRICPGIQFGLANVELSLAKLLYHFDWKLPNEMKHEELSMAETFGTTVKRKDALYLIPIVHQPFSS